MTGKIVKGIAGFYYVDTGDVVYECKAKGIFRKDQKKPLVGDNVELEILDETEHKGNIIRILPRNNALIRPAVANVDQALVIFAFTRPRINYNLLDRFLIQMERQQLPCVLVFNKMDIAEEEEKQQIREVYAASGYPIYFVSAKSGEGMAELAACLKDKTSTVAGPSGVGKSSLVNRLQKEVSMETGEISKKIERGRQTTRHTQLIPLEEGGFILDTPGFSSIELYDLEKEDVWKFYPEFLPYEKYCRFAGCAHINEPDCGIKQALEKGKISRIRYENYAQIYDERKNVRKY